MSTPPPRAADPWGPPTDWSLIVGASAARTGPEAERRWGHLLERYRHAVTLTVRRRLGRSGEAADDLVDAFFSYLFTADVLTKVDRERGRFRCFLQVVLKRFVSHEQNRAFTRKALPLLTDVAVEVTPEVEREEEAEWAAAVLKNALEQLARENQRAAEVLMRSHGIAPYEETSTEALCAEYQLKANAFYQLAFRARKRLRELIYDEIRATVLGPEDFEVEKELIVGRLLEAYSNVFVDP